MDTSDALALAAAILSVVTAALNAASFIAYGRKSMGIRIRRYHGANQE